MEEGFLYLDSSALVKLVLPVTAVTGATVTGAGRARQVA